MSIWLTIACVLAALAVGLPLSIWATAGIRRNKNSFAVASALFFAFGLFNPEEQKMVEAREDTDNAKRQKSGDPPEP